MTMVSDLRSFIEKRIKEEEDQNREYNATLFAMLLKNWDRYQKDISNGAFLSWDRFEDTLKERNENGKDAK